MPFSRILFSATVLSVISDWAISFFKRICNELIIKQLSAVLPAPSDQYPETNLENGIFKIALCNVAKESYASA